jgi:hypothetical protein
MYLQLDWARTGVWVLPGNKHIDRRRWCWRRSCSRSVAARGAIAAASGTQSSQARQDQPRMWLFIYKHTKLVDVHFSSFSRQGSPRLADFHKGESLLVLSADIEVATLVAVVFFFVPQLIVAPGHFRRLARVSSS